MVTLTGAATAASLYPAYHLVTAQIAQVNTAIANSAILEGGTAIKIVDPIAGDNLFTLAASGLTAAESAAIFNAMLTILQARQTVLSTAIANLS